MRAQRVKQAVFTEVNRWIPSSTEETIIVAGAPRSGTTWLAELLRELPGYKLINEPLRLNTNPRAREAGFDWRTHVEPGAVRPELERHLRSVLEGDVELGPAWHFRSDNSFLKLKELMTHRRNVVKFCRAGRMLHWMANTFEVRGTVVIIRQPCAVIASMLNMGDNWAPRDVHDEPIEERFAGRIPQHVRPELQKIPGLGQSWVGHLAIGWSLDHYFAFHGHPQGPYDYPWVLTCYEKLFADGVNELTRIVNALDGVVSDRMRIRMGKASSFAAEDFLQDEEHQLTKWRTELSEEEIDIILKVVAAFDLDFYTAEPTPGYHQLYQFQRSSLSSIDS